MNHQNINFYFSNEIIDYPPVKEYIAENNDIAIEQYSEIPQDNDSYKVLFLKYCPDKGINVVNDFKSKKSFDVFAFITQKVSKNDIKDLRDTFQDILGYPGVLQKTQIDILLKFHILLFGVDDPNSKPAKYDLTLSKEYFSPLHGNELQNASEKGIAIPPLSFLLVMANEICNFPRNICGIFDLRVSIFCQGIILANGVQVDPGYRGVLLSLLFNSSSNEERVAVGASFASIMFFTLASSGSVGYEGEYLNSSSIAEYLPKVRPSGFSYADFTKHGQDIKELFSGVEANSKKITELKDSFFHRASIWIAGLAIIIALLAGTPILYNLTSLSDVRVHSEKIKHLENYSTDKALLSVRIENLEGQIENLTKKLEQKTEQEKLQSDRVSHTYSRDCRLEDTLGNSSAVPSDK